MSPPDSEKARLQPGPSQNESTSSLSRPADTWVITAAGADRIRYWSAGGFSLGGATYRQLGLPDSLTGTVCTFATKTAAIAAYRAKFGSFPRDHRAAQLTAEQVAMLTPEVTERGAEDADAPVDNTNARGLLVAAAAAAAIKAGLNLVACGERDDQRTYNLLDARGKRRRRVHVALTLDEVFSVLERAEPAENVGAAEPITDVENTTVVEDAGAAPAGTVEPIAIIEVAPVSGVVIVDMDAAEAREVTDQIRAGLKQTWELIERAYLQRAWLALGHASWDDYCAAEFGTDRLQIPRHERPQVVSMLRQAGLSIRAIAAATGDSVGTVHRAIEAAADGEVFKNGTPAPGVTGTDGKTYAVKKPEPKPAAEPKPVPGTAAPIEEPEPADDVAGEDVLDEPEPADFVDDDKLDVEPEPADDVEPRPDGEDSAGDDEPDDEPLMKTWKFTYRWDGTAEMVVEFVVDDDDDSKVEFYESRPNRRGGAWAASFEDRAVPASVAADLACQLKAAMPAIRALGVALERRGREGDQ